MGISTLLGFARPRAVSPELFYECEGEGEVSIRWLGTAGFVIQTPSRTVVLDPFVTRTPLLKMLGRLVPNEALIEREIPEADDVIIGHSHYDHILDAPSLCVRTGARLIGCPSACNVGRAGGVPEEQLVCTEGNEDIPCGDGMIARGIPSVHGRVYGIVPLQGTIDAPPKWPPRNRDLRHGIVFNWYLEHQRRDGTPLRVLHVDSAEFFTERVKDVRADVLCLCAIGRNYRPRYLEELVELTRPKWIVPCHWDWLFDAFDAPPRQLPGVDLEGFVREIAALGVEPVVLPIGGAFRVG